MNTLSFERKISSPRSIVWEVISDVGNYADIAPNIDHSKIISGQGEGMVRKCSNKDSQWTEECIAWRPEESFAFKVNTHAKDYPYPLKLLRGNWGGSQLTTTNQSLR